jgi:uncharacterized protein (UPF0333 family)
VIFIGGVKMKIIKDEAAQTSAELLLLFGGIIVVVVVFAVFYRNYLSGLGNEITNTDLKDVTDNINALNDSFK